MDGSEDPFYRYTMPKLEIKVEGTTKMIKTQLTNIDQVAQAVGRPPTYLVTFFGQELNSNAKYDTKEQKAYVTGNQELAKLQELVFTFIKKFVMCKACNNPETQVSFSGGKKKKDIILNCISCGSKSTVDPLERFCKFIIQHPPDDDLGKGSANSLARKPSRSKAKAGDDDDDDDDDDDVSPDKKKTGGGDDDDDEGETTAATTAPGGGVIIRDKNMGKLAELADEEQKAAKEAKKKEKKEKKEAKKSKKEEKKSKKKKEESDDDDDDWAIDTSEAAVAARQAALCAGMENVVKKAEQLGVTSDEHLN